MKMVVRKMLSIAWENAPFLSSTRLSIEILSKEKGHEKRGCKKNVLLNHSAMVFRSTALDLLN